ncbi:MAG: BNR-4 repeat-containing protein [Planctomycetota bacterium]|nr:BNR-4 repeat-containing protein [Planctomycetota bacterium]
MPRHSAPFLLSSHGSVRGTAYCFSNKSVTLGKGDQAKTHVVWLDRPATVNGRTYDHATRTWGPTHRLFEGSDNHTSPALVADGFGDPHLRLMLGPHGAGWNSGRFLWAISDQPGRIDAWKWQNDVGYLGTYPCFVHTPQGLDAIVYRGGEWPPSTMFQRQRSMRHWTKAREIFWQDLPPQYTHYASHIDCDAKGALYLASHFYTQTAGAPLPGETRESRGVAILKSSDLGETWSGMDGEPVAIPALFDERLGVPASAGNPHLGGLNIDSRGNVWAMVHDAGVKARSILVSRWGSKGWEPNDAARFLPAERMPVDATLTIDSRDRLHLAVTALLPDRLKDDDVETWWGHASCEVFHMVSADAGKSWSCHQVSPTDDKLANWLPNISRNSVLHPVEKPTILYTHGLPGGATPEEPETEIYCVRVEEM